MAAFLTHHQVRGVRSVVGSACSWLCDSVLPPARLKSDRSYLGLDRPMQSRLVDGLRRWFPRAWFAAEEAPAAPVPDSARCVISIDPIDGTALHLCGINAWSVLVAIAARDDAGVLRPRLGLIAQPGLHRTLLWHELDDRGTVNGRPLPDLPSPPSWEGAYLYGSSDLLDWHLGIWPDRPKARAWGATGAHLAQLVAPIDGLQTRSDPAVVLATAYKPHDILAGATIAVRGAGLVLHDLDRGRRLELDELWQASAEDPAASPPLLIGPADVVDRLATVAARRTQRSA